MREEITCLKELTKRKCLEYGDIIKFIINEEIIEYRVRSNWLGKVRYKKDKHNDEIFRILDIDKFKMAEKEYGYKSPNINSLNADINWPETVREDYPALTRLVRELCIIIEERKPKYTKYNRFEIMDI